MLRKICSQGWAVNLAAAAATHMMVLAASPAQAVAVPETVAERLKTATISGGVPGLLQAIGSAASVSPNLVATPDAAASLAEAGANLVSLFPFAEGRHYGAVAARVISSSPKAQHAGVTQAVVDAILRIAPASAHEEVRRLAEQAPPLSIRQLQPKPVEPQAKPGTVEGAESPPPAPVIQAAREDSRIKVGTFVLRPSITVSEHYDDNIFATRFDENDDFITTISPSLRVESDWDNHVLNFDAGYNLVRYSDNVDENHHHYRFSTEGRFDISDDANTYAGASYRRDVEDRENPDDVNGSEPTEFDDIQGYLGAFKRFGDFSLRVGGTYQQLDFDDVPSSLGTINNDDRDRKLYTGGARATYQLSPEYSVFAQAAADIRRYDAALDDGTPENRDSDGFRAVVGTTIDKPGAWNAELFLGYLAQDYDDTTFKDVNDFAIGGRISWFPSPLTTISGFIDRTVEETTIDGASSQLSTGTGVTLAHDLTRDLMMDVRFSYYRGDYQGLPRKDHMFIWGAGLRYNFMPSLYLQGDYQFRSLNSTQNNEDYDRNQVFIRFGAEY